jgi:hypothetical protein
MVYKPIKLDRDLWIDRTKAFSPERPDLKTPETLKVQSNYVFEILNYDPKDTYIVNFSKGTWTQNNQYIRYTTPSDYYGPLKLSITVKKGGVEGVVFYEDGTVYTEDGTIDKAEKLPDGRWKYKSTYCDYDNDKKKYEVPLPPLPFSSTRKYDKIYELGAYDPSRIFGILAGSRKTDSKEKSGGFLDYHLPSELNSQPDERKYFYKTKDGKFLTVPRNSNVTESGGDIFSGYRKPGEVGGSLTVYRGPDQLERTFEWDFEILLWDLEAFVPDEIIAQCLTSVGFTPVLRGVATGHTYLWEQISGDTSSVTWLTPKNQKDVVINLGGLKVDRVFRFWISKGTRYEKHYDIYLYGTPLEKVSWTTTTGLISGNQQNHINLKVHECTPILLHYEIIWSKQLRVNIVRNY